jgi:hypothetical protein
MRPRTRQQPLPVNLSEGVAGVAIEEGVRYNGAMDRVISNRNDFFSNYLISSTV